MCKHCENGRVNRFGEELFCDFNCELRGSIAHDRPQIFKTNGMYFLKVENFGAIKVIACPICGRAFETVVHAESVIKKGDMVMIVSGTEMDTYAGLMFEVLSHPYEVCGEYVVKMKCHETGKYFGGGYSVKYLKKVEN